MNTLAPPLCLLALAVSAFAACECQCEEQVGSSSSPPSYCDGNVCDVTRFPGNNDDEKIESAIAEALESAHKTVYFPNGTYRLKNQIRLNSQNIDHLVIKGQSVDGVVLESDPIIFEIANGEECFGPMFNIDRSGGFTNMFLNIEELTLDFSLNIEHPIFTNAGCSGSGHGVRVGNGWDDGQLTLKRLKILKPPGYGIGIQNSGPNDKDANNVILTSIRVEQAGSDGLDTKQSPNGGNSGLTIIDMTVDQIGFNDERSAAGLDISYNNFYAKRITIITDAYRTNPKGTAANTGIRIRSRTEGSASNGIIRDLYINGGNHGVFFEGKGSEAAWNKQVTVKNLIVENFEGTGLYIRGKDHEFKAGCVYGGYGRKARPWYIDGGNADRSSIRVKVSNKSGPKCPSHENVGSNF